MYEGQSPNSGIGSHLSLCSRESSVCHCAQQASQTARSAESPVEPLFSL